MEFGPLQGSYQIWWCTLSLCKCKGTYYLKLKPTYYHGLKDLYTRNRQRDYF